MATPTTGPGRPKSFKSAKALIDLWVEFNDWIAAMGYMVVPTQSEFCRWMASCYSSVDRKTVYNALNRYFPNIKKSFEQIQSDTIVAGGMLGKYNPTMSIFALKNWCSWVDSQAQRVSIDGGVAVASSKLSDILEQLRESDAEESSRPDTRFTSMLPNPRDEGEADV